MMMDAEAHDPRAMLAAESAWLHRLARSLLRDPEVGSLRARCAVSAANETNGLVTLKPIDGATKATRPVYVYLRGDGSRLTGDVPSLLPGRYLASLESDGKTVPCGEIEVRANEVHEFVWPR